MHELSIALSIVESAEEAARINNASVITKVEVEIGSLAGVETDALLFAWDSVIRGTMAENSSLVIQTVPAEAHCLECSQDFPIDNFFSICPHCNGCKYQVFKGKELRISSLTIEE